MHFAERKSSLRQQADGRTERRERKGARSHEGELSFWEDHWSPTRPLPLFDGKQEDYKAIMNNWHLNASHCPALSTVHAPPPCPSRTRGKMQFFSLKRGRASALISETFCFIFSHLCSGSWCLAEMKAHNHDSLGDASSALQEGGKTSRWETVSDKTRSPQILMRYPRAWTHSGGVRTPKYRRPGKWHGCWLQDRNTSILHDSYWKPVDTHHMNVASTLHQIWGSRQGGSMLLGVSDPNMVILGHQDLFFMSSLCPADMMRA